MKYREQKPDHQLRVYGDITELIASPQNPTPLVRLNRINPNKDFHIYLKLERYNPFGSVKDRIAYEMLKDVEVDGKTVVEPSSGNTGIALASVANALGIPVEIAVPENNYFLTPNSAPNPWIIENFWYRLSTSKGT